jgi:hypothetical protein
MSRAAVAKTLGLGQTTGQAICPIEQQRVLRTTAHEHADA